jgi:hypothetical protein
MALITKCTMQTFMGKTSSPRSPRNTHMFTEFKDLLPISHEPIDGANTLGFYPQSHILFLKIWNEAGTRVVGVEIPYGLDGPKLETRLGQEICFSLYASRPSLRHTGLHYKGYRDSSPGIKRQGHDVYHPPSPVPARHSFFGGWPILS